MVEWRDLIVRFALGGVIVSLFSAAGDLWKPKTFAGIFGAAPSVALASLALTFSKQGPATVTVLARSMVWGALALLVYGAACVFALKHHKWPVALSAMGAWITWAAVAFVGLGAARLGGLG